MCWSTKEASEDLAVSVRLPSAPEILRQSTAVQNSRYDQDSVYASLSYISMNLIFIMKQCIPFGYSCSFRPVRFDTDIVCGLGCLYADQH